MLSPLTKNFNRGFTLIELLVVIAIVGVLSAVVLNQLNSARSKGLDASKRAAFKNLSTAGALFYEIGETYNAICSLDAKFQAIYTSVGGNCNSAPSGYRVRVQLTLQNQFGGSSGTDWLCTDATGIIKVLDVDPGGTATTC